MFAKLVLDDKDVTVIDRGAEVMILSGKDVLLVIDRALVRRMAKAIGDGEMSAMQATAAARACWGGSAWCNEVAPGLVVVGIVHRGRAYSSRAASWGEALGKLGEVVGRAEAEAQNKPQSMSREQADAEAKRRWGHQAHADTSPAGRCNVTAAPALVYSVGCSTWEHALSACQSAAEGWARGGK